MPDKQIIELNEERFLAPEILFNPGLLGSEEDGLAEKVFKSINSSPMDLRKVNNLNTSLHRDKRLF